MESDAVLTVPARRELANAAPRRDHVNEDIVLRSPRSLPGFPAREQALRYPRPLERTVRPGVGTNG